MGLHSAGIPLCQIAINMQVLHTPQSSLLQKRGRGGDSNPMHKRQRTEPNCSSPSRFSRPRRTSNDRQTFIERPQRTTTTIPRALFPAEYQNRAIVLYQPPETVMQKALASGSQTAPTSSEAMDVDM